MEIFTLTIPCYPQHYSDKSLTEYNTMQLHSYKYLFTDIVEFHKYKTVSLAVRQYELFSFCCPFGIQDCCM